MTIWVETEDGKLIPDHNVAYIEKGGTYDGCILVTTDGDKHRMYSSQLPFAGAVVPNGNAAKMIGACPICRRSSWGDGTPMEVNQCSRCGAWMCLACWKAHYRMGRYVCAPAKKN